MAFVHDAGRVNLRKGLRAAVVVPILYAGLHTAVGDVAALYAAFASFSALVFADFQGRPRRKIEGYAALAVLGTGLIVLGSVTAEMPVVPAIAIFLVTFTVRFVGCLGGYAIAAGTTLMLAFALAVLSTPVVDVDQRVLGWVVGCVAAALASLVAPLPPRLIAVERLAAQSRALSVYLRTLAAGDVPPPLDLVRVREVREDLAVSSARPLTPTARQTALGSLVDVLGRATLICQHLPAGSLARDLTVTRHLAEVGADAFDAAAVAMEHGGTVELSAVHEALVEQRQAVVDALDGADDAWRTEVADAATTTMRVRFVASLGAIASAAAATWRGDGPTGQVQLDVEVDLPEGGIGPFWQRARRTLGFHLRWGSSRFRDSMRAGVALAAALIVARTVDFNHGFWVALGTLMVLRSGISDTTTTALQALRGTLLGFAIAAPIAYAANGHDTLLWILLPLTTFLAGWVPGSIGLGGGQAAFTVFVVVLFNLAAPAGTQTAVLRVETVLTGIAVAVAAGFLFWPRGPVAGVGPIAGRLYRAAAGTIRAVTAEVLGLPGGHDDLLRARHQLIADREQLEETLQELASDHRASVAITDRVAIMTPPALVRAGDWARVDLALGSIDPAVGRPTAVPVDLEAEAFEVAASFDSVADWLDDAALPAGSLPDPARRKPPSAEGRDPAEFLRLVWLWSWLTTVDESLRSTADDTVATVRALPKSWWR